MKKILGSLVILLSIFILGGCSSEKLTKNDLHSYLENTATDFANLLIETQTKNESDEYFDKKIDDLTEQIREDNKILKKATVDNKSLKKDIQEYNDLVKDCLYNFYDSSGTDYSYDSGIKLREIADEYFDGEIPSKMQELYDLVDENAAKEEQAALEEAENSRQKELQEQAVASAEKIQSSDITKLADTPSSEQEDILDELALQQFNKTYPYKGSKIHSILGVIQDWTQKDGSWYYKSEATIVNEFGAERNANVEIHITPIGPDTGMVTILDY